jgi:hypothetical protein
MINKILNIFGSNNTYSQNNISEQYNYYSSEIETLLKSIDGYFSKGDITEAFNLLNSAIAESKHKQSRYPLFLKKIEYLLETRNIDEAKKVIGLLSKDYNAHIDTKYKEHLLFIYSLEKKEKDFFEMVEEIKSEKEDIKPDDYFKILYSLNSGNLSDAKNLFEAYSDTQQKDNYLIGGHIFANLYTQTQDKTYLEKATEFYQIVLDNEPSFLLKMHVDGFFVQNIINEAYQTRNDFDKKKVMQFKATLNKAFEAKKYFNKTYINQEINFYAFILLILEFTDEYLQFYDNHASILFNEHCLQYYHMKNIDIEHSAVQKNIAKSDRLLINYASLMIDKTEQKVVLDFFEKNYSLLFKFDLLIYFYIQSILSLEHKLIDEIKSYINDKKLQSYELYQSYLLLKHYNTKAISNEEIQILLEFLDNEQVLYAKIIETINFLEKIKMSKHYVQLATSKIHQFEELIGYTLTKCWHDKELKLEDFELFLNCVNDIKYFPHIADIYLKYNRYGKSFEFFQKVWENEHNSNNAKNILVIGINNFEKFNDRIDEEIENEALLYLQSMQKELSFNDISLVSYYSLTINKDMNNAFGIINKKILGLNVYELDNEDKQQLATLYFNSLINFNDKEIDGFEKNTIFIKDHIHYLDKDIFKNIDEIYIEKFNIALVDKREIQKIYNDKIYEKKSLFHFIVNQILETIDSPYFKMVKIDFGSETPLEEIQKMLVEQSAYSENQFEEYSAGENISFWSLAGSYDKYFNLIAELLENNTINFNSCKLNMKDVAIPKLLTLSSIIFLNYHKKLATVLSREDVFIQKTAFDWLNQYIEELSNRGEQISVFAKDGKFYKDIITKEQINSFISRLKEIIDDIEYIKIVDDTKASLPFKNAFDLSKYFGIQEYQALSLSFQENYQIITEDRIFEVIFETMNFNQTMISNSLSLLDSSEVTELRTKLYNKRYRYIFDINILRQLVKFITKYRLVDTLTDEEIEIIKILDEYGWLESIKRYYINKYKVLYPKTLIPEDDYISKNIEYILTCIDYKVEELY